MREKAPMTLRSKPSLRKKAERRLMSTKSGIPEAKPVTTQMPMRLERISRQTDFFWVGLSGLAVAAPAASVLAAVAAAADSAATEAEAAGTAVVAAVAVDCAVVPALVAMPPTPAGALEDGCSCGAGAAVAVVVASGVVALSREAVDGISKVQ